MYKRQLIAAACIAACASGAHAQSNVTLYGITDVGLTYVPNESGQRQIEMASGVKSSPRWGLKGREELGAGLSAVFKLEAGFSSTTGRIGQGGAEFGRQVYVGFADDHWGVVTLGRQYTTFSDFLSPFAAVGSWAAPGAGYGAHPGDLDNLDAGNRVNNSVKYLSQTIGGFQFGAQYSFGNVAGQFSQNQQFALAAGYARGPFKVAVGYQNVRDPNFSFFGNEPNGSTTNINISSPAIRGFASARTLQNIGAGASYQLGSATLGLIYTHTSFDDLGGVAVSNLTTAEKAYRGSAAFDSYEANVKYDVTSALQLAAAYAYTDGGYQANTGHYNQVSLGADYALSKQTDLYALAFYEGAAGRKSNGGSAIGTIDGVTNSSTPTQFVYTAGIRHRF